VFQVLTTNAYNITTIEYGSQVWIGLNTNANFGPKANTPPEFRQFNDSSWKDVYYTDYLSGYGDLILAIDRFAYEPSQRFAAVSSAEYLPTCIPSGNNPSIANFTGSSLPWINYRAFLNKTSEPDRMHNTSWPVDARIAQAFATIVNGKSRIELSIDFMIIVIVFNALKLSVMLWVLFTDRSEYLVTLGDAVASFLEDPDLSTAEQCMLDKDVHIYKHRRRTGLDPEPPALANMQDRLLGAWQPTRRRYLRSLSKGRQDFFVLL
jgi:hypothetical protein